MILMHPSIYKNDKDGILLKNKLFTKTNNALQGELYTPGDKSISHRAIMLGSIAKGTTVVDNFLDGEDCLRTIEIFRQMGVNITQDGTDVTIESGGVAALKEPTVPLYFGNSGTTARLMLGILPALPFYTVSYGDAHMTVRPMDRVITPLSQMGAVISGRKDGLYLPLSTHGTTLKGIHYELPVKSAQVKSAVLLAGLFAEGETTVVEQAKTRNHTENMLHAFGADIKSAGLVHTINNKQSLTATNVTVPGDISSAAFFIVAAAIVPGSSITLKNVGLNDTRTGIIDAVQEMGGKITISNQREISGELLGDIHIAYQSLQGVTIDDKLIPRLIDELPVIALLATQAEGKTVIKNAEELRVKETDRIHAVVETLTTLGANVEESPDGMIIHGKTALTGGKIKSYSDHRMAMMGVIASLISEQTVEIDDVSSIAISYPSFFEHINQIKGTEEK